MNFIKDVIVLILTTLPKEHAHMTSKCDSSTNLYL